MGSSKNGQLFYPTLSILFRNATRYKCNTVQRVKCKLFLWYQEIAINYSQDLAPFRGTLKRFLNIHVCTMNGHNVFVLFLMSQLWRELRLSIIRVATRIHKHSKRPNKQWRKLSTETRSRRLYDDDIRLWVALRKVPLSSVTWVFIWRKTSVNVCRKNWSKYYSSVYPGCADVQRLAFVFSESFKKSILYF